MNAIQLNVLKIVFSSFIVGSVHAQAAKFKLEGVFPANIGPDGLPSEFHTLSVVYDVDLEAIPGEDGCSFSSGGGFDSIGNPIPVVT